ncbi:Trm112 family protein [Parvularcula dongshanensis]|uniref:UPF0434 protein GGQ59_000697 n=1 Tax=Parvularcula dongshanensis TaxID=1173995 RepID=A0A840I0G1_9PROT|nr:Trm112 family protein [Parvularcula dongshanensis]MBB4658197.1 hypothetical protein [Parvularcula dongshanensis]
MSKTDGPRRPDPALLALLVCPVTRAPLTYDEARSELISEKARLAYPIRDGIPVMLEAEARRLDEDAAPITQG